MKKNLRIVSAAAAALLAVAPVAATVAPAASTTVSAATITENSLKGKKYTATASFNPSKDYTVASTDPAGTVGFTTHNTVGAGTQFTVVSNGTQNAVIEFTTGNNTPTKAIISLDNLTKHATENAAPAKPSVSTDIKGDSNTVFDTDTNVAVNLNVIAGKDEFGRNLPGKGSVSGNIVATLNGQSYTGMISNGANGQNVTFTNGNKETVPASELRARTAYDAHFSNVAFSLGSAYSNKEVTLTLPEGAQFVSNGKRTKKVTANVNGVADTGAIVVKHVYAVDPTDMKGINFYAIKSGNVVTSGSVDMNAVNGQLNVESVFAAVTREYGAAQVFNDAGEQHFNARVSFLNNLRDQLKAQNIQVDANGYFKAPASFSINMTAKSQYNNAEATLPVTVNVAGATADNNNAAETTKNVTIMHISTIYDKNGKATHDPALRAYDTYSVVSTPVTLKDEKGNNAGTFYKLAGKDQYIKVGNVDGTSRSLKHNAYVYKSTGKRNGKKTLKKGSSVTTYGKSFMIAGHQMYRIGRNQYVKKANF